jgi:hypothetical protein
MSKTSFVHAASASLFAVSLAFLGSAEASAAGADVSTIKFNDSSCNTSNGFEICQTSKGTLQRVIAPNGYLNFSMNFTNGFTVTAPDGTVRSESNDVHQKYLIKDGTMHVSLYQQSLVDDFGPFTCTLEVHSHLVDGKVQFDRGESTCTQD